MILPPAVNIDLDQYKDKEASSSLRRSVLPELDNSFSVNRRFFLVQDKDGECH
jgi:hypothetical protein